MEETATPKIVIRTSCTDGHVQLEFEDNGAGIPEANRPRLFHSFFTTKKSGIGIGLGICRSIVDAHQGTITAECASTGGAVFVMRFPQAVDAAA
jgi:signal transduction histidine kinase